MSVVRSTCRWCGVDFTSDRRRRACDECKRTRQSARAKAWGEANPAKRQQHRVTYQEKFKKWAFANPEAYKLQRKKERLRNTYGLTLEQYYLMVANQDGLCGICKIDLNSIPSRQVHLDHSCDTGVNRGILCHSCNVGLGHFRHSTSDLEAAIKYLRKHA